MNLRVNILPLWLCIRHLDIDPTFLIKTLQFVWSINGNHLSEQYLKNEKIIWKCHWEHLCRLTSFINLSRDQLISLCWVYLQLLEWYLLIFCLYKRCTKLRIHCEFNHPEYRIVLAFNCISETIPLNWWFGKPM